MTRSGYLSFFLFFLLACQSDSDSGTPVLPENIQGDWEVIEATRNNRPALSLEKSQFFIGKDSFATNFLPDKNAYPYSYDGKVIRVMNEAKNQFKVSRKAKDTLIFRSIIQNFEFKFTAVPVQT